jgi:hypothetical protein
MNDNNNEESDAIDTLVCQVIDELAVLAVLSHERLAQLKDGRVDGDGAVPHEGTLDDGKRTPPDGHLRRQEVACALGDLGLAPRGVGLQQSAQLGQLRAEVRAGRVQRRRNALRGRREGFLGSGVGAILIGYPRKKKKISIRP